MRPGLRVGKYVLGERIAHGGMAEVWAARVEGPEGFVKHVALKFILETFSGDTDFERLFVNEARVAAQLQHANLVTIFDFDKVSAQPGEPGRYYIAMEKVEGCDLRRVLQATTEAGRAFPVELALHAAGEVLKGLRYVHDRLEPETGAPLGLVHRDVSPHNVLVGMGGEVKLSDFGIAKAMRQSLGTQSGTIRGKLSYASPEQLRAEPVDHRTDQFALGVTLWEMLAQRRLFDGVDEVEIIGKVLRCEIPPLGEMPGGPVHPAIEDVVRTMLAPARDARFPTTTAALSAVLALPGYTHDGSLLSELMTALFGGARTPGSSTVRLDVATPLPLSPGRGPNRRLPSEGPSTPPPFGWPQTPGPTTPRPFSPHTPPSSPSYPSAGHTRTVTGSELSKAGARPPRRKHASGYVSAAAFEEIPIEEGPARMARGGRRPRQERSPAPWIAGALGLLGLGVGAFFLLPSRSDHERTNATRRRAMPEEARASGPSAGSTFDRPRNDEPLIAPTHEDTGPASNARPEDDRFDRGENGEARAGDGRGSRSAADSGRITRPSRASKPGGAHPHTPSLATFARTPTSTTATAETPAPNAHPEAPEAPRATSGEGEKREKAPSRETESGTNDAPIIRDQPNADGDSHHEKARK